MADRAPSPPAPSTPAPPAAATVARRGGVARRVLRGLLGLAALGLSIVVLAWLTLQWGILPRIDHWRLQIEARAGAALGVPVRIGAIHASPDLWAPRVQLDDVVLHDSDGREALRLPRVTAMLTPGSLLPRSLLPLTAADWRPHLRRLEVDGAHLALRRDAQGRLTLAGIALDSAAGADGAFTDWLLSQGEVVVTGSTLDWIDEPRGGAPLALRDVELRLGNTLLGHTLHASFAPPSDWGQPLVFDGRFSRPLAATAGLARRGDWRRWSGSLDARATLIDLAPLALRFALPLALKSGRGTVNASLALAQGRLTQVTADLVMRSLELRLSAQADPLHLDSLTGKLQASAQADGLQIDARSLAFRTREGVAWPAGDLSLGLRTGRAGDLLAWPEGAPAGGTLEAQRIDLAVLASLVRSLPRPERAQRLVDELHPEGLVEPLSLRWQADAAQPGGLRYTAKGSVRGLGLRAQATAVAASGTAIGRPGLRRADVAFDATDAGGSAQLKIDHGALEFPGVFETPAVALDRAAAELSWRVQAGAGQHPALTVQVAQASFANADAEGELKGRWRTGAGSGAGRGGYLPGLLELDVKLARAEGKAVARYLPLQLGETARGYVRRGVQAGRARSLVAHVDGDLWDFPFAASPGTFRLAAQVEGVTLDAVPHEGGAPWPLFTDVAGELVFERGGMVLRDVHGGLAHLGSGTFALSQVNGRIADLAHAPQLEIEGLGRGPLADGLRYVAETPVGGWLGGALARAQGEGPADLRLALAIPLQAPEKTRVKGAVTLAGNDLRLDIAWPSLQAARGRVDFNEAGFAIVGGRARVLGGEASFEGGFQGDAPLRIKAQGSSTMAALADQLGAAARPWFAELQGQAAWRGEATVEAGRPHVSLQSDLVGVSSTLPAPLAKRADEALALRVQSRPAASRGDEWQFALGDRLQAQAQVDGAGTRPQWLGAAVRVGAGARDLPALPARGIALEVDLPQLSLDAWQDLFEAQAPAREAAKAGAGDAPAGAASLPLQASVRVADLAFAGRHLSQVVARVTRAATSTAPWQVELQSQQAAGRISYQPPESAQAAGRVQARLSRLAVAKSEVDPVETLLGEPAAGASAPMPALDIVVEDFELRGKRLGRLEIEASNRGSGDAARDWTLSKLNLTLPEAQFNAVGQWSGGGAGGAAGGSAAGGAAANAARSRTQMTFRLDLTDSGALLTRLGQPKTLRGGKGRMTGQLSWQGSPLAFNYPSLTGTMNLDVESGQFLKADPGFAKLLGVLSLQSLPRRLLFDFRDVFQEGFSFDAIGGDVVVADGEARTRNLRMRGVQAVVLMEGVADLARETQDLRAWVVPEINAGTASLAYAVINPLIGLGTFIGQLFLRRPLAEANTREFHITGTWSEPQVYQVQHSGGAPVAEAEASAPPPAAASATPLLPADPPSR